MSADLEGSRIESVTIVSVGRAQDDLIDILHERGTLRCSVTHPLMVRKGTTLEKTPASRICPDDPLVLEDLSVSRVVSATPSGRGAVSVIGTGGSHLFFAGDAPVLGHNAQYKTNVTVTPDIVGSGSGVGGSG